MGKRPILGSSAYLKAILFILTFFVGQLAAQLNAPELRCLEVLSNGQVKITWLPPADPANLFFSYEVFSANNSTGPFALAGTIGALSTNTFVHSGNANATSLYYFMRTVYGSAGASVSGNSDTIRTLFLNLIPAAVDLKLVYNNLKTPKLPSSSLTFTISKEYPIGTWNVLGQTNNLNYQDTLTVCQDSMSYGVSLSDNSGCFSASNVQRGKFTDLKPPNEPYVDSISVMPNGQTVLSWRVPRDPDIIKYYILMKDLGTGSNVYIDTVLGRLSTIYTYTPTTAMTSVVRLYVSALDSCNNISTFNEEPVTIFLESKYDVCAYQTSLTWNVYKGMHKNVAEYRIYYSVNGGAFNQIGSTTQTTYTHTQAGAGKNLCYIVRAINTEGLISASSNPSCFFSKQVKAPNYVYIKKASVVNDKAIEVTVLLDTVVVSKGVEIHRSENGSQYTNVGFVSYNNTRHYSFTDATVQANKMSYYYKAIVRDSCDNIRNSSSQTKTMLLKVKQDEALLFTQHLSWNDYLGFGGGVSGYNVYRIINKELDRIPIGFTDAQTTQYTDDLEDAAAAGAQIDYLVEAVEGITNPYGLQEQSLSNSLSVYLEGRLYVPNAFAPEGKNKTWKPITHFIDKSEYRVMVFNRWGNKVYETNNDNDSWDGGTYPAGLYVYLISYKNSRGEYQEAKGTVYLFR